MRAMDWQGAIKLAGAFAVPLVAVDALFSGITSSSLQPVRDDVRAMREDIHALGVRMARLEVRLPPRVQ